MDVSVLHFSVGTLVPYPSIPVDIVVLLMEPCLAEDYNIAGNICDYKVNCMALLCSCGITYLYHMSYDRGSAQRLTIDCSDKRRITFLHLAPSCLHRL